MMDDTMLNEAGASQTVEGVMDTLQVENWDIPELYGDFPLVRGGHTAVLHQGDLYVFGGYGDTYLEDLTIFDTVSFAWYTPPTHGVPPIARNRHTAALCEGEKMWVFGGYNGSFLNDLFVYNIMGSRWEEVTNINNPPSPRAGHDAVAMGSLMFVFGGYNGEFLNDLQIFDSESWVWREAEVSGDVPGARAGHTISVVGHKLYVFGGHSDGFFGDMFVFDTRTFVWARVESKGFNPAPRAWHSAVVQGNRLLVVGGYGDDEYFNDFHVFDTQLMRWTETTYSAPVAQGWHTCTLFNDILFMYGGYNGDFHNGVFTADIFPILDEVNLLLVSSAAALAESVQRVQREARNKESVYQRRIKDLRRRVTRLRARGEESRDEYEKELKPLKHKLERMASLAVISRSHTVAPASPSADSPDGGDDESVQALEMRKRSLLHQYLIRQFENLDEVQRVVAMMVDLEDGFVRAQQRNLLRLERLSEEGEMFLGQIPSARSTARSTARTHREAADDFVDKWARENEGLLGESDGTPRSSALDLSSGGDTHAGTGPATGAEASADTDGIDAPPVPGSRKSRVDQLRSGGKGAAATGAGDMSTFTPDLKKIDIFGSATPSSVATDDDFWGQVASPRTPRTPRTPRVDHESVLLQHGLEADPNLKVGEDALDDFSSDSDDDSDEDDDEDEEEAAEEKKKEEEEVSEEEKRKMELRERRRQREREEKEERRRQREQEEAEEAKRRAEEEAEAARRRAEEEEEEEGSSSDEDGDEEEAARAAAEAEAQARAKAQAAEAEARAKAEAAEAEARAKAQAEAEAEAVEAAKAKAKADVLSSLRGGGRLGGGIERRMSSPSLHRGLSSRTAELINRSGGPQLQGRVSSRTANLLSRGAAVGGDDEDGEAAGASDSSGVDAPAGGGGGGAAAANPLSRVRAMGGIRRSLSLTGMRGPARPRPGKMMGDAAGVGEVVMARRGKKKPSSAASDAGGVPLSARSVQARRGKGGDTASLRAQSVLEAPVSAKPKVSEQDRVAMKWAALLSTIPEKVEVKTKVLAPVDGGPDKAGVAITKTTTHLNITVTPTKNKETIVCELHTGNTMKFVCSHIEDGVRNGKAVKVKKAYTKTVKLPFDTHVDFIACKDVRSKGAWQVQVEKPPKNLAKFR